ncbi:hypothetical protein Hanom_Chr09g00764871 [Helianthus anomalus]
MLCLVHVLLRLHYLKNMSACTVHTCVYTYSCTEYTCVLQRVSYFMLSQVLCEHEHVLEFEKKISLYTVYSYVLIWVVREMHNVLICMCFVTQVYSYACSLRDIRLIEKIINYNAEDILWNGKHGDSGCVEKFKSALFLVVDKKESLMSLSGYCVICFPILEHDHFYLVSFICMTFLFVKLPDTLLYVIWYMCNKFHSTFSQ